jgi:hypothetical protein
MNSPKFVQKDTQPDGTVYEIYSGTDCESAKEFLATQKVSQKNYFIVVETPDGNWGTDIQGLYLEQLLAWQNNLSLANCEGIAQPYSIFGVEMAARRINDNFIVTTQPKGATKLGRKGLPMKARRKAWRAICPFLRAVER